MEECKNQEGLTRISPKREGWITEAAHITLLDQPHNGPDVESNISYFCQNHYVLSLLSFGLNFDLSYLLYILVKRGYSE